MTKQPAQNNAIGNLLIQICKLRRNKSNALLAEAEIHSGQDALLYHLSIEDGQTVSSLVEKLCIQHGTIASMIERMETSGMIKKEKDANDKRTSRIYLTPKGKEALTKIARVWKTMESLTTKGLTEKQENTLRELLQQVLINLK
ncbi:MarR family winged helix-turn-helix transcriptional regulator [Chitinophaga niabensis]|uniref:DNA-binding transcriptional regulator, MarR family n=1 Tax=Chitinophaga niabensis TaxID=536979 RepID=A0A1N6K0G0_9BACT|nr:MarR family winged helix-turn-helix transcriptional regulator [Chitinophaga niabensis]SIO49999.1 DNA-binding transcriptional regulator, MarR family [Chitinophaga niabensis]